jgi:beta-lactamase class A
MIVHSDNYSYSLLTHELNHSPGPSAYYTFRDLDVLTMMTAPKADYISIQSYGNLFAILYNTGYLSKEMSQFALELLSETTFNEGLVAGVPKNIRVAHKFGYRTLADQDSQLHDCGIVYHPSMSYVLCIMTSGPNFEDKKSAIADLSRIVYENIAELHLQKN